MKKEWRTIVLLIKDATYLIVTTNKISAKDNLMAHKRMQRSNVKKKNFFPNSILQNCNSK